MNPPVLPGHACPDCAAPLTRRQFLAGTAASLAVATWPGWRAAAAEAAGSSETLVTSLHRSLTEPQRAALCFPFDDPLRLKVDNNWNITKSVLKDILTPDQQALVREIFLGLHSPEYADTVMRQVVHDSGGDGFDGSCSIALFGEPGTGKFEFVLTGRHCTRRCDGDSVAGAAFGGPIFYGHAAQGFNEPPDHPGNAYWYQARRANEVFQMFDGRQRGLALLDHSRPERGTDTVKLTGQTRGLPGIPVAELSADQKQHVRKVMADLLGPFRQADAAEALRLVEHGGFDNLHLAFFKNQDVGNDGVWDVWQIEGPHMLWYLRGDPHVHCWVHIRNSAA